MPEAVRLLSVVALLLALALLCGGRLRLVLYSAQCGLVCLVALAQALLQADPGLVIVAAALACLGAGIAWTLRRGLPAGPPAQFPIATAAAALLLVALAAVVMRSDALMVPLAITLVGLLAASVGTGWLGVLLLLNGVVLAIVAMPGMPLRPLTTLALAAFAAVLASGGRASRILPSWLRP
jgi:hypothetical protein